MPESETVSMTCMTTKNKFDVENHLGGASAATDAAQKALQQADLALQTAAATPNSTAETYEYEDDLPTATDTANETFQVPDSIPTRARYDMTGGGGPKGYTPQERRVRYEDVAPFTGTRSRDIRDIDEWIDGFPA